MGANGDISRKAMRVVSLREKLLGQSQRKESPALVLAEKMWGMRQWLAKDVPWFACIVISVVYFCL